MYYNVHVHTTCTCTYYMYMYILYTCTCTCTSIRFSYISYIIHYAYIIDPVVSSSPSLISSTPVTSFTDNIMSTASISSDLYIFSTHFVTPTPSSKLYLMANDNFLKCIYIQSNYSCHHLYRVNS